MQALLKYQPGNQFKKAVTLVTWKLNFKHAPEDSYEMQPIFYSKKGNKKGSNFLP